MQRFVGALLIWAAVPALFAEDIDVVTATPEATIDSLQRGLVAVAEDAELSVEQRYERLHPVVTATHDLAYIAELAVRRHWDELDAGQRARYLAAFETLSVMTYASRFGNVTSDSFIAVTTPRESADSADVHSAIRASDGEEVSLDYSLRRTGERWQIVNIVADGVSDLALKRAEYRRILTEHGADALIEELGRQADDLAGG